jgi:hypothetical protein
LRHDLYFSTLMRRSFLIAALAWAVPARSQPRLPPGLLEYAGSALARLIGDARQQTIADGVRPLPMGIYRALFGYFPPALLQRSRFATGISRALSLPALAFSYGDASAITLGEVILFNSERVAETDLKVWAHELTHVMQYQRWGIDGFADRYVRDSAAVEREAIDNAKRFMDWQSRQAAR